MTSQEMIPRLLSQLPMIPKITKVLEERLLATSLSMFCACTKVRMDHPPIDLFAVQAQANSLRNLFIPTS